MEIPDQLRCLFAGDLEEGEDTYHIEVPPEEVQVGNIEPGETYRIALFPTTSANSEETEEALQHEAGPSNPPVSKGEERTVEIEDIGDQGDGITRVERGYVVIVPDTETGERVTVRITDVRENVAFAEVEERVSYYD